MTIEELRDPVKFAEVIRAIAVAHPQMDWFYCKVREQTLQLVGSATHEEIKAARVEAKKIFRSLFPAKPPMRTVKPVVKPAPVKPPVKFKPQPKQPVKPSARVDYTTDRSNIVERVNGVSRGR